VKCCACGCDQDVDGAGLEFRPISFSRGMKSGQPVPEYDFFPDNTEAKFVCWTCLMNHGEELIYLMGLDGGNHDLDLSRLPQADTG
jgi:hypothetical protein